MSGHNTGAVMAGIVTRRGTTNGNARGSAEDRRRRREWLVQTYKADRDMVRVTWFDDSVTTDSFVTSLEDFRTYASVKEAVAVRACRCYRCGQLLTVDTVTVDRIIPGCKGGTYRRTNIRPACGRCNSETGAPVRSRTPSGIP